MSSTPSLYHTFEDYVHVDEIWKGPVFKLVAITWLKIERQDSSPSNDNQGDMLCH